MRAQHEAASRIVAIYVMMAMFVVVLLAGAALAAIILQLPGKYVAGTGVMAIVVSIVNAITIFHLIHPD